MRLTDLVGRIKLSNELGFVYQVIVRHCWLLGVWGYLNCAAFKAGAVCWRFLSWFTDCGIIVHKPCASK